MAKATKTEPAVEEDRRAPDEDAALEQTFEQGTALDVLPEEDRRTSIEGEAVEAVDAEIHEAPAVEVTPLAPNDALSRVFDRGDGVKVDASGCLLI